MSFQIAKGLSCDTKSCSFIKEFVAVTKTHELKLKSTMASVN